MKKIAKKQHYLVKYLSKEVTIFLHSGRSLRGKIINFDRFGMDFQTVINENPFIFKVHYIEHDEIDTIQTEDKSSEKRIHYAQSEPFFNKFTK
jgi:sRNA-binding regulator protein Hfq